jgi:hypothetical protein
MGIQIQNISTTKGKALKVFGWMLVAAYTFVLPNVYLIYRNILESYGSEVVGKIPVILVAICAILYAAAVLISQKSLQNLLFLVPCAVIAVLIIKLVDNPNKHIHIPEYVLMTWLLFFVLFKDHKGKGIFLLIFIYASLLGVVDELEQGIHPRRFYGVSDMIVNSASALIGIFTILGLKKVIATNWEWKKRLKDFKPLLALGAFGLSGAILMCIYLFQVQAYESFLEVYPEWLLIWNILYQILTPLLVVFYFLNHKKQHQELRGKNGQTLHQQVITAQCWIYPFLVILFYMHALVVYISISGAEFR